jgi:hypothetical protein
MSRFRNRGGIARLTGLLLLCASGAMAQGVQGVHPDVSTPLQIGIGYTYVRFNEVPTPSTVINSNGFTASAVYYRDWVGAEAEVTDAFGTISGKNSQLLFTGGGIRLRWPSGRTLQPWIHGVLGYSHLSPQPTYGLNYALGYKAGGGVDYNPHHSRLAFRASVDLMGNHFFKTYQLSPEVSAGVVFLFKR